MFVKALDLDTEPDCDVYCSSHFISPSTQLAFRALALGYCLSTLFSSFVYNDSLTFFTFFTNLSYILLTCYFGVIVVLSTKYSDPIGFLSSKKIKFANVLQEVVATNALFLDIVYWGLLYHLSPAMTTMQYFYCVNVHLINLLLISFEVLTSKFRFHPRHVLFTVSFLIAYTIFAIVYYFISNNWVYPILDWHQKLAPLYYTMCFALNITCFFVLCGVYRLREKYAAKRIARTHASPLTPSAQQTASVASPVSVKSLESAPLLPNYGSFVQYPSLSSITNTLGDASLKSFSSIAIIPPTAPAVLVGTGAM